MYKKLWYVNGIKIAIVVLVFWLEVFFIIVMQTLEFNL